MDKLQAGVEQALTVFVQTPALFQPGKRAFHDPALRYHDKGVQFIAFGHLHCSVQGLLDSLREWLAGVTAIDQNILDA
jgi:hypothetical protein